MATRFTTASIPALLVFLTASSALAKDAAQFDLPSQDLAESLKALGVQTKLNVLVDPQLVEGLSAPEVKAHLTMEEALSKLLSGTDLQYRFVDEQTVVIQSKKMAIAAEPAQSATQTHTEIEEIVVTAQKRAERLKDVPSSVSVLGSKQMLESHQTTLIDYAATTPGLQVESSGPGLSTLTMRGLALGGAGSTVGTYIDDMPFGSSSAQQAARFSATELLPYDLERIEVLRGPQGTFYGANALGGLVKYVTKVPDLHEYQLATGADILGIKGGDDAGHAVRIAGSAPLIDDQLAIRASYAHDYAPGYIDIPALNRQDVNETTRQTGNLALLWQATDELSLKLTGLVEQIDSADVEPVRLDLTTKQPALGDLQGVTALAQPFKKTMQMYSATVKYDLGGSEFTSASSFAHASSDVRVDTTASLGPLVTLLTGGAVASPLVPTTRELAFKKYTQEFRLATTGGTRLEGMLGAFFTHEDAHGNRQATNALDADGTPIVGLSPLMVTSIPSTYQEEALFGNLTYKFTERFDLSVGMRYGENQQKFRSIVAGSLLPGEDTRGHSSESVFNYSVAPRFRFNEDVMAYLRVATGYRPGSANLALNASIPSQSKSDRITNYEAGVKSSLFDQRLELNVAAFQIDWQDVQLSLVDLATGASYQDNGKTARSRGIEWESIYRPIERLRLGLTATYIDAVLTDDLPDNPNVFGRSGDRLPAAPRFRGAATFNYSLPISAAWDGYLGGTYQYVGSRYTGVSSNPLSLLLERYSTVDFNVGAENASWSVNLFVRNLGDERAYVSEILISDPFSNQAVAIGGIALQPRTIGVSVDRRF